MNTAAQEIPGSEHQAELSLTLEMRRIPALADAEEGETSRFQVLFKLFRDGRQLGCITSIDLHMTTAHILPDIRVGIVEGMTEAAYKKTSEAVKRSIRDTVDALRQFPYVQVVTPSFLT